MNTRYWYSADESWNLSHCTVSLCGAEFQLGERQWDGRRFLVVNGEVELGFPADTLLEGVTNFLRYPPQILPEWMRGLTPLQILAEGGYSPADLRF